MQQAIAFLLVMLTTIAIGDESKARTAKAEYAALSHDYEKAREAWSNSIPQPRPDPGDSYWIDHDKAVPDWDFAPRFIAFAEAKSKDPTAADAALTVLQMNPGSRDRAVFSLYLRARDILIRDHLEDEKVVQALLARPFLLSGNTEPYFRALVAKSSNRDTVARAWMALVNCNQQRLRIAARPFFDYPDDHPDRLKRSLFLNSRLDPEYINYIRTTDVASLLQENETILERVVKEYADIPLIPAWRSAELIARNKGKTLADPAKSALFRYQSLGVGKVAPEIEGQDIDGKPMRLSEYRGKVVVLVFWATWCGPCISFLPTEKALTERLKNQPFALLGINGDEDRAKLQATITERGITWRSWFDGGTPGGPIADRWDIPGWPTIIVIDKEGVIRFKNLPHHTPDPLDDAVDSLLTERKP